MIKKSKNNGFTLIELLCAVFILSFGIAAILQLFSKSILSSNAAWDLTVASSHAEIVLEEMQSRKTIDDIVNEDWTSWSRTQGLISLPKENIVVKIDDLQLNPLPVNVIVAWDRNRRGQQIQFQSRFTK